MSLTVQQLLSDARRLSSRLREHEGAAEGVISSAQEVLRGVEAMREYQDDLEQLNAIAHNRPRAQLVLGIQQENRHIRQLQHENKELRAALEESQNAIELIMSKYRQHMSYLVNSTKLDKNLIYYQRARQLLQEKTDQICEMVGVIQKSIQLDEEASTREREVHTRLITENKGLREMLEISRRNGTLRDPIIGPRLVSRECQTDVVPAEDLFSANSATTTNWACAAQQKLESPTSFASVIAHSALSPSPNRPPSSSADSFSSSSPTSVIMMNATSSPLVEEEEEETEADSSSPISASSPVNGSETVQQQQSSESEDEEVTFNTIKRQPPSCSSSSTKLNGIGNFKNGHGRKCNIISDVVVNGDLGTEVPTAGDEDEEGEGEARTVKEVRCDDDDGGGGGGGGGGGSDQQEAGNDSDHGDDHLARASTETLDPGGRADGAEVVETQ